MDNQPPKNIPNPEFLSALCSSTEEALGKTLGELNEANAWLIIYKNQLKKLNSIAEAANAKVEQLTSKVKESDSQKEKIQRLENERSNLENSLNKAYRKNGELEERLTETLKQLEKAKAKRPPRKRVKSSTKKVSK